MLLWVRTSNSSIPSHKNYHRQSFYKRKLFIEALTPTCSLGDSTCKNFKNKMEMSNPMIVHPLLPAHQFMPYMYACLLSMYIHVCMFVQWIYTSHGMYKHVGKWLTHRSTEVACFYSLVRCLSLPPHLQMPLSPPESSKTLANNNCVGISCKSSAHTGAFYIESILLRSCTSG